MKLTHVPAVLLFTLLLTACGDGGLVAPDPVVSALTPEEEAARIEEILEGCATEQMENALEVAELLAALSEAESFTPIIGLAGLPLVTENQILVTFTLDIDADDKIDGTGSLTLLDANKNPTNPFDLSTLLELLGGGVDVLPDLLALLPDDTFVRIGYTGVDIVVGSGTVDVRFVGGSPVGIAGTVTAPGATCTTTVTFREVSVSDFTAEGFPPVILDAVFESGADTVVGVVRLEDTGLATATLALNSGTEFQYVIDLATGEVTRSP